MQGKVYDRDDYSFYVKPDDLTTEELAEFSVGCSHEKELTVTNSDGGAAIGRAIVSKCREGRLFSVTLRKKSASGTPNKYPIGKRLAKAGEGCLWMPNSRYGKNKMYFAKECDIIDVLYGQLQFVRSAPAQGLIVISGPTNSSKSRVARGLAYKFLEEFAMQPGRKRNPHLVTFEDPIEVPFHESYESITLHNQGYIDYTPRRKGVDSQALNDAVTDALRQTPSIFFVGEIREDEDLRQAMRFAATGHLMITTMHSGSLTETMEHLLQSVHAETPAQRGSYASRIYAVVNCRKYVVSSPKTSSTAIVPSTWKNSSEAVATLVADGLASILPHASDDHAGTSLGRYGFVSALQEQRKVSRSIQEWSILKRQCLDDDLAGR